MMMYCNALPSLILFFSQAHEDALIYSMKESVRLNGYITKHEHHVYCVAIHPKDNNLVVSAGWGGKVKLVSADTGIVRNIWETKGQVNTVSFSPDGTYISAGQFDHGPLMVFHVMNGNLVCTFTTRTNHVKAVAWHPHGKCLASGNEDGTVCIWEVEPGSSKRKRHRPVGIITGHTSEVTSLQWSPDGKHLASGSCDQKLCMWSVKSGQLVSRYVKVHTSQITSFAWSPDGKHLASSCNNTVYIWHAETGKKAQNPLVGNQDVSISCLAWSPDSRHVACGQGIGVLIWDVNTGANNICGLHSMQVYSIAWSPNGTYVASASADATVRTWPVGVNMQPHVNANAVCCQFAMIYDVLFSPDGRRVASCGLNLKIWDSVLEKEAMDAFKGHSGSVSCIAWSPDCKHVASGGDDGTVRICDAQSGKEAVSCWKGRSFSVKALSWSPDGKYVAIGRKETILLWDMTSGTKLRIRRGSCTKCVSSLAWSPDGKYLASASENSSIDGEFTVILWDCATRQEVTMPKVRHFSRPLLKLEWSPDGMYLACISAELVVHILDAATGEDATAPLAGSVVSWVRSTTPGADEVLSDHANSRTFIFTSMSNELFLYLLDRSGRDGFLKSTQIAKYYAPAHITSADCMGHRLCIGLFSGQV
jgi:WD40 repeat protein